MTGDVRQRPCIVLDTNALLQSIPSKGKFRRILESFDQGRFLLVVSNEILLEYEEVLEDRGGPHAWPLFRAFLEAHSDQVLLAEPSYRWHAVRRDPDDNKFVDAAVAKNAEWIVTEDSHFDDLLADQRLSLRPLHPERFIELLRANG